MNITSNRRRSATADGALENGHAEPISAVHSLAKHNSGENIPRDSRSSKIAKITALFETKASTEDGELAGQKKQKPTRKPARGIMQHLLMFEQNTESGDQLDDLLKTPAQSKSTQSNIDCSDTTRRESQDWDTDDGTNEGLPASASLDDGLLAESCSRRVTLDPIEEQEKQKSSRVASFKRKVSSKKKDKQAKQEQESKTTISLALKSLHHAPQPQSGKNAVLYGSKQAKCDQAFKPSKSVCIANNTTTTMHMDRKAASAPPPSSRQPVVPQSSTSCSSASNQQHEQDEYSDLAVMRSMTSERSNSIASILSDDEAPVPFRKRLSNVVSTCSRDSVSSLCISSSSPPPLAETCYILQRSLDVATSVTRVTSVTSVTSVTGDGCGSSSSQTNIPTSPVLRAAQQADDSATCSTDGQTLQQCQIPASANCSDSESSPKSTGGIVKSEPRLSSDQQQPSDMQQRQEEEQKPVLVATMSNSGAGVAGAGLAGAGLASAGLASAGASETHTTGSSGMAMSPSSSLSSVGSDILQVSAACSAASFWNGKVVSLSDVLPVACLSSTITSSAADAAAISAPTATNTSSTAAVSAPTATSTSSTASPTTATSAAATASSSNTASIASASFLDSCAVQSLPLSDTSSSEPVADMVDRVVPTQDVGAAAAAETGSSPPPVPTSADSSQQPPIVLHRACTVAGEAPTGLPLAMVLDEDSNRQHGLPVCTCPKLTAIASNCPVHSGRRLSSPSDPAVAMDAAFDAPPVIIHHRRRSSLLSDTDNDSVLSIPMRRHSGSDTATAGTSRLDANGYESGSSWDTDEDCNKRSPFNPSYASDTDEECNKAAIDDPVFINHSDISVSASPADMAAAAAAANSTSVDRKRSSEDAAPSRRLSKQLKTQSPVDEDYDIDNDDDAVFTVAPVAAASLPAYEFTTKHRRESVQSQPPSDISPMASTTTTTVLKLKSTARQHQSLVGFSLDQVTDTLPSMRTVGAASDNAAEKTVEDDNDQVDRHLPLTNSSSASGVGLMRLRFRSLKNFNKAASHESDGDGRGSQDPSPTSTDKHRRQAKSQKVKASSRSSLASLKTNESNDEKAHRSTSVRARILRIRSSKKKSPPKIQPTASEPTVSVVNGDAGDEPAAAADTDSTAGHVLSVGKHKNLNARHSDPGGPFEASPGSPSTPALSLLSLGKSILKSTSSLISLATGGSQTPAAASTNSSSTGENINASIVASTPATDSERSTAAAAAA
eukprot:scpid57837/ scgid33784/ 